MYINFEMDLNVNVFTLNCWDIPVVSKNRKERIEAIVAYLLKSSHNVVCLQEIWSETDYLYLKENLKSVLPYAHYFYSGVLGSGLCVFSKWVIHDVFFHQWPLNGYIHKIHHGDWFGGKGVGLCRLKCNDRMINIYCTHLHAQYHEDDIYLAHRMLQAYSTAEFVKLTSPSADLSILAGDMNTAPGDLSYRIITQLSCLEDPFNLKCEGTNPSVRKEMGTCDTFNNSYSDPKLVAVSPEGKRLDYILFKTTEAWEVNLLNFGNPLEDRVPGQPFSYSDHNAVSLELELKAASDKKTHRRSFSKENNFCQTVADAIQVFQEAAISITGARKVYLTVGGVLFMFLLGTVGFWQNNVFYDILKLLLSALCFYCLLMGTLWNKIEMNSLKSGLSALQNFSRSRFNNHVC